MISDQDHAHLPSEPDRAIFAYLLLLTESDRPPEADEGSRIGTIRRGPGGHYWIFDGESWLDW